MSAGLAGVDGVPFCSQLQHCEYFFGSREPQQQPCRFIGDPDIAGLGIIIAFLVAAWLAFVVVLYTYFFVDDGIAPNRVNQLDQYLIQTVRRAARWLVHCFTAGRIRSGNDHRTTAQTMHLRRTVVKRALLSLSDQQLVTGIAVLSVGFAQTAQLTEYHFQLLSAFAWLSFTVYQCAAVVLERVFHMSRFMALWRSVWIVAMLVLLFVSTLVTYHSYWLVSFGTPSICVWKHFSGGYASAQLGALILLVVFGIVWGGVDIIYGFFPSRYLTWLMKPLDVLAVMSLVMAALPILLHQHLLELEQKPSRSPRRFAYRFCRIMCYPFAVLSAVLIQLLTSRMVDLLRVWAMSLFYSSYIFVIRSLAPYVGLVGTENGWAFGQAVAVFMLLLPFFGIVEAYLEEKPKYDVSGAEDIPLHRRSDQETFESLDYQPMSTFLAQTRTIAQNTAKDTPSQPWRPAMATDEDNFIPDQRDTNASPSVKGLSRFHTWREKYPAIEMLAAFERAHYEETTWFGVLMIVIVVLVFGLATMLGLVLLVLGRF